MEIDLAPDAQPRIGLELRRIRQSRGLSQRTMARMIGLSAHSAVADYEAGRRLPHGDILRAYETALELPPGSLCGMRDRVLDHQATQAYHASVQATRTAPAPARERKAPRPDLLAARALVLAAVAILLSGSASTSLRGVDPTWAALTQHVTDRADRPAAPANAPENMDGDDPRARDCVADAMVRQEVPLLLPGGAVFGSLRLRHSARCGTSWGSAHYSNPNMYTITIVAHRPRDAAAVRSEWSNNTPPGSYGDMLSTAPGCVWVEAWTSTPQGTSGTARTGCLR
jgi:transcriptional regulator with XRE-family HTH domain